MLPSCWPKFGWWQPFLYKTGLPTYRPLDESDVLYLYRSNKNTRALTTNLFVWVVSGYLQYLSTQVLCRNSTKENEHQKVFISVSTFWRPKVHRPSKRLQQNANRYKQAIMARHDAKSSSLVSWLLGDMPTSAIGPPEVHFLWLTKSWEWTPLWTPFEAELRIEEKEWTMQMKSSVYCVPDELPTFSLSSPNNSMWKLASLLAVRSQEDESTLGELS